MKTLGLIGGMSWESTIPYYRIINEETRGRLGGLHSAKIILYSVEFDEIEKLQAAGEWEKAGEIRGESRSKCLEIIDKLRKTGAEGVILGCTELGLLIRRDDIDMPVFDTTVIHAEKAAELALEGY